MHNEKNMIPVVDEVFVKPEHYDSLEKIITSRKFFPVLLSGETGTGKTYLIEQICAKNNIPMYRVNITAHTDEHAMMGGFRLKNDNGVTVTVYEEGPVIKAMRDGALFLLDEMDLGTPQTLQCLMSVLEGKGYFIKDKNEHVHPTPGFNIVATANTKGVGDETGKYVSTNILNEAYLERFIAAWDIDYPKPEVEKDIILRNMKASNCVNESFADRLVTWANEIREAVRKKGEFNHNMPTRRLVHIVKAYSMFGNEDQALDICLSRFDEHHKKAFKDLYNALIPKAKSKTKGSSGKHGDLPQELIDEIEALEPFD